MWPSKPEVLISPTVRQILLQFWRQTWGFRPRPERRNWPRRLRRRPKSQHGRFARQSRNLRQWVVVAIIWLSLCRARHNRISQIWHGYLDVIYHTSRDVIISGLGPHRHFRLSVSVVLTCQHYFTPVHGLIPQCCWNFNCTFRSLRDISISGFRRHFRLSLSIGIA